MTEIDDHELLAEFARNKSDWAFDTLVSRYVNLVYSTAFRFTRNEDHSRDITQTAFIILSRKAGTIRRNVVLSGWLYHVARLTSSTFIRTEMRRQKREQEAYMQYLFENPSTAWDELAPQIDDVMGHLGEADRNAIVLRFFENKTAAETATALNISEAAAAKRTSRALEKLRKILAKRGVTTTTAIVAGALSANAVHAAPVTVAITITSAAKAATLPAALTTIMNSTMKTMTWLKLKTTATVAAGIMIAGGVVTIAVSQPHYSDGMSPAKILESSRNAYQALSTYSDEGKTVAVINGMTLTHTFSIKLARPNLYRIEWQQPVHSSFTNQGIVWSTGDGDFMQMNGTPPMKQTDKEGTLAGATGVSGSASATIPGTFFQMNWGNQLALPDHHRLADATIGGVDCYVLTSELKGAKKTMWIGKQDLLIHQVQTITSPEAMKQALAQAAEITKKTMIKPADITQESPARKIQPSEVISTETHEHIILNQPMSPADFAR